MTATAYERLLDRLRDSGSRVTQRGQQTMAQCPAHEDRNPSLSITAIEGSVLLKCWGNCDTEDVLAALNLTKGDLFDEPRGATYRYDDGRLVHRTPDKKFRQSGNTKGQPSLYRLAKVQEAVAAGSTVYLVEGEKDVHALESVGAVATTAPQGSSNVDKVDASPLHGAHVVAIVDRDKAGQTWAGKVRQILGGKAASLHFVQAAEGKDAADHIAAGHGSEDLVPLQLEDEPPPPAPPDDEHAEALSRLVSGDVFILDTPAEVPAVWGEGNSVAWAEGEALTIAGPAGVGKTTLCGQVTRARIVGGDVLGMPVAPTGSRVLYLAMDRPRQIARSLRRTLADVPRETLRDRLVVWPGPPIADVAKHPETLLGLAQLAGADTVVIDSIKDAAIGLSDDEVGAGYNRARQLCLANGVEVLELHHMVKKGANGTKPTTLADLYGSVWIGAGSGSVALLWGAAGDPIVEWSHLKQPAEEVGPFKILHDHDAGTSAVWHSTDLLMLAKSAGHHGITAKAAAASLFTEESPTPAQVMKARRKLDGLAKSGHLTRHEGDDARQKPVVWTLTETLTGSESPYPPYAAEKPLRAEHESDPYAPLTTLTEGDPYARPPSCKGGGGAGPDESDPWQSRIIAGRTVLWNRETGETRDEESA
ncbi:MAG TPA: AAA family ATPase [Segeticoccus sp.]|uniref:AAA family ATPase n=1 Tax=Segeticoccus sp. TaxID=2706531 RepID=UPI002D7E907B|nr:AAA family ATPase [Segeticoccus sp.]HET8601758.1 AAA family ATPase [Segeticoccus sp.]